MGKQEIDCARARTWTNDQLAAHPATRGLSIARLTEYDPLGDPITTGLLLVGAGESQTIKHSILSCISGNS
jgi:hypothetical protein